MEATIASVAEKHVGGIIWTVAGMQFSSATRKGREKGRTHGRGKPDGRIAVN